MNTTIALVSGGLDSVTLAHQLREDDPRGNLVLVSFDYGQKHRLELRYAELAAETLGATHRILTLPTIRGSSLTDVEHLIPDGHFAAPVMRETIVPNRNMILLSHSIALAVTLRAQKIAVAAHAGDAAIYPDCRPAFVAAMTTAAIVGNEGVLNPWFEISAPYIGYHKHEIAWQSVRLGISPHDTYSCYRGEPVHCGTCGACNERREAFLCAGGIDDKTVYAS